MKACVTLSRSGGASGSHSVPRQTRRVVPAARAAAASSAAQSSIARSGGLAGAIPFEHGEFGMMQRPALTVAKHMSEREQPRFAGRQQLLAGEFRRGMQEQPARIAVRPDDFGRKG
jgi:hypothetical protein